MWPFLGIFGIGIRYNLFRVFRIATLQRKAERRPVSDEPISDIVHRQIFIAAKLHTNMHTWIDEDRQTEKNGCLGRSSANIQSRDVVNHIPIVKVKVQVEDTLYSAPHHEAVSSQKRKSMARVVHGSHSFTCRPRVYPRME